MAKRLKRKRPTNAELMILGILWDRGPTTVREVHEVSNKVRKARYTTSLKQMQVMLEKGLLKRDDSRRPQIYRPAYKQEHTQRQAVNFLADMAFAGSAANLAMLALQSRKVSAKEITQIEKLLRELKKGKTK